MTRACVMCGKTAGVVVCTVSVGAETAVADLCETCRAPLVEIHGRGRTRPNPELPPAPPRHRGHTVVPID